MSRDPARLAARRFHPRGSALLLCVLGPAGALLAPGRATADDARAAERIALDDGGTWTSPASFNGDTRVEFRWQSQAEAGWTLAAGTARLACRPDRFDVIDGHGAVLAGAARPASTQGTDAFARLTLVVRSNALELTVDDRDVLFYEAARPFGGGALAITVNGGPVVFEDLVQRRLPWFDGVLIDGLPLERRKELAGRELGTFRLEGREPSRIDPVFHVAGDGVKFDVRVAGVRPADDVFAPLEQALAYAQIRPILRLTVLQGEAMKPGPVLDEGATVALEHAPARLKTDVFIGVIGVPPTASVYDAATGTLMDRSYVGGPPAAALHTTIPDDCAGMRVVLVVPELDSIERHVTFTRP